MSKTSQRKKQKYAEGFMVGSRTGKLPSNWKTRRSSVQGWQEYRRGIMDGIKARKKKEAKPVTFWSFIKAFFSPFKRKSKCRT